MEFEGAVIKEQGVTFAVVIVKPHILSGSDNGKLEAQAAFARFFPGIPVVLMARDSRGVPTYWGRKDIAKFLASISMYRISWKKYAFN